MSLLTRVDTDASAPAVDAPDFIARGIGVVLALAVAWIHVKDQGGFPGDKAPHYVGIGYYLLEAAALLVALGLLATRGRTLAGAWLLSIGVAAGPLVGFVLSRGPGLPNYADDKGNWTEPLAVQSVLVETVLVLLALWATYRARRGSARG